MKKILLLLISIYTFSNSAYLDLQTFSNELSNKSCSTISGPNGRTAGSVVYSSTYSNISNSLEYEIYGLGLTVIFKNCTTVNTTTNPDANVGICQGGNITNGDFVYICNGSDYIAFPIVENGTYDNEGNVVCNPNYFNQDGFCVANPPNGYFDEGGNLQCNSPYVNTDNSCTLPPNTNPDGTCSEGSYKDLVSNSCQEIQTTDNNDGSITTNDGNGETTDYPTGTTVNYNPETGVTTTTYPDGTSIIEYPDGTTTNNGGSVNGGGGSNNGSSNTDNSDSIDNGDTPSFMCDDGAPSLVTSTGFQTCDRTCESVGYVGTGTGADRVCSSSVGCPDGQTQTGSDLLGNPICYEMSNNADIDLNKIETLLGNIKDNTSLDKNSNKQLGTINNNIVRTNGKLEAVKGGLSIINKNVVGTNAKLEAVKGGLAIIDTSVNKVNTSLEASNGYLDGIGTILADMVSPIDSDKQTQYESQISSHLTNTLNDSFTKYSNVLGFGSSYGTTPSNITVTLFNTEFTLIDFSILDNFVSIIRSLFHTLAYLYGFMFFLRGSK